MVSRLFAILWGPLWHPELYITSRCGLTVRNHHIWTLYIWLGKSSGSLGDIYHSLFNSSIFSFFLSLLLILSILSSMQIIYLLLHVFPHFLSSTVMLDVVPGSGALEMIKVQSLSWMNCRRCFFWRHARIRHIWPQLTNLISYVY